MFKDYRYAHSAQYFYDIGNGIICNDIDECLVSNGGCDSNAVCSNMLGSRTCTCKMGYTGNGTFCENTDECLTDNGGCSSEANCTDTMGSRTCNCRSGYAGMENLKIRFFLILMPFQRIINGPRRH